MEAQVAFCNLLLSVAKDQTSSAAQNTPAKNRARLYWWSSTGRGILARSLSAAVRAFATAATRL